MSNGGAKSKPVLMTRACKAAEGVGFEPTVGFKPTLDFESSAFNRTQPPFLCKRKRPTLNVQCPMFKAKLILDRVAFSVAHPTCDRQQIRPW